YAPCGHFPALLANHPTADGLPIEAKTILPEEARGHRFRNELWKSLGTNEVGDGPEVKSLSLELGDRILLCTDGLWGVVSDEQIWSSVKKYPDVQACA